jgi:hypothetical protein
MKRLTFVCMFVAVVAALFGGNVMAAGVESSSEVQITACGFGVAPRLTTGAQGRVTPGPSNRVRSVPSLSGVTLGYIPAGATFTILAGPVCESNFGWWQVNYNGLIGWTAEGQNGIYWLEPAVVQQPNQCVLTPRLAIGGQGRVTPGLPNALRSQPYTGSGSTILGRIPSGGVFTILSGPSCDNQRRLWWQVNYNGTVGWTPEGEGYNYWAEPYSGTPNPTPVCNNTLPGRMVVGRQGYVLPGLPNALRSQPYSGTGSAVLGEIPGGAAFTVTAGPSCDGLGRLWWQVNYNGLIGWTAEGEGSNYWIAPL